MPADAPPPVFLDVPTLLETSLPRPRFPLMWFLIGVSIALMVGAALIHQGTPEAAIAQFLATMLALGVFLSLPMVMRWSLRQVRDEQATVTTLGEMVQMRRWVDAAGGIQALLSRPLRSMQNRSEALVLFAAALARYHRFDEAAKVQDYLLEHELLSPPSAYGVRLARAMGLLRQDHLFDANQAMSELRRSGPADSGYYALVELYRDVKTGHPQEAIDLFQKRQASLRAQLGHRLGDAFILSARAYDMLGRGDEAGLAFRSATLLQPLIELVRRYPEVEAMVGRFQPAAAPPEMA